jgi:hypothetical protein
MMERQARQNRGRGLLCVCGSLVESHVVERKRQTRKRCLDSDSEQVEYVREVIAHFIPLDHLPDGVLATVFSFCSSEALASIDLTCSSFGALTPASWEARALERFGWFGKTDETVGKSAYQAGSALLRPNKVVCVPLRPPPARIELAGTPVQGMVHPYGRIIVTGSDDHSPTDSGVMRGPAKPLVVRDVTTSASVSNPSLLEGKSNVFQVSVVGADNDEVIVYGHGSRYLHAHRANPRRDSENHIMIDMERVDSARHIDAPYDWAGEERRLLGCRRMLIIARRGHFFVYVPDGKTPLKLVCVKRIDPQDDCAKARGMAWASPEVGESTFCCCPQVGRVCAWRIELQEDESVVFHEILDIQTDKTEYFEALAVTEKYVAVSPGTTKCIFLYSHNGVLLSSLSEGLDVDDLYVEDDQFIYPTCMFATGEILVSTSIMGAALCAWDMKRGALVHRFTDAFSRDRMPPMAVLDELPDGCDVTSMLPLRAQGAACFCTSYGNEYYWGFPGNDARHHELVRLAQSYNTDDGIFDY